LFYDSAVDIGEAKVAAGVTVSEFFVIEAEEPQDRGVEIVNVNLVLNRSETKFVGRAVDVATFDAAAGEPGGEAVMIVVATVNFAGV
jgi:hypothetical protein